MGHVKKRYWISLSFLLIILLIGLYGWRYWCSFKQEYGLTVDWHGVNISFNGITFDEVTISQKSQFSITSKNLLISWTQFSATDLDIYWQSKKTITSIEPMAKVVNDTAPDFNLSSIATIVYWLPKTLHVDSLRFYQEDKQLVNLNVDVTKQQEAMQLVIITNDQYSAKLSASLAFNQFDSRIEIHDGLLIATFNQSGVENNNITLPFSGWLTNNQLSLMSLGDASLSLEKLNLSQDLMLSNSIATVKFQVNSKIPFDREYLSAFVQLTINKVNGIYQNSEIKSATGTGNITIKDNQFTISIPVLNLNEVNLGIAFETVKLAGTYTASIKTPKEGIVTWTQAKANIFSGSMVIENNKLNLAKLPQKFDVRLKQIQLKDIFAKYPVEGLVAEGSIDGSLPVTLLKIKKNNEAAIQTIIKKGKLLTNSEGYLRFENSALKNYVQSNPNMKILTDLLKNFHYTKLTGNVDYANDIAKLGLNIQGSSLDVENGKAVNLNITLEENIAKLMMSLLLSDQISEPIRKRIEARLK